MVVDALSSAVKRLIVALEDIDTVDVLLHLANEPERYWSVDSLAIAIELPRPVEPCLERLARLGLVDVRLGHDVLYRYLPASSALDATVKALAHECEERRFLVLGALASASMPTPSD